LIAWAHSINLLPERRATTAAYRRSTFTDAARVLDRTVALREAIIVSLAWQAVLLGG
jgi:hypothetical protein